VFPGFHAVQDALLLFLGQIAEMIQSLAQSVAPFRR
jgi:hypothetical protein